MYGLLTQDIAKTYVADREREIARMAVERAAGDTPAESRRRRLIDAVLRMREWSPFGVVRTPASVS